MPLNKSTHALLDPLIQQKGEREALKEASPITYVSKQAPPFLEILGDKDEYIPFAEATNLQAALNKEGVECKSFASPADLMARTLGISFPNDPDWEAQMIVWLNRKLHHQGAIGEGIVKRVPVAVAQ